MIVDRSQALVPATISIDEAASRTWDVVIAGAGPAGALTACLLARQGVAVLLVDKAAFPRAKTCGCCLNGAALAALSAAGLQELPGRLGAIPLHAMLLRASGREATFTLPGGVSLSRNALDAALIRAAIDAGAAFLPEVEAAADAEVAGRPVPFRTVRLRHAGGPTAISARICVAADGLAGGFLRHQPDMRFDVLARSPFGVGTLIDEPPDFYREGVIFMACSRFGYVGMVRLEDGRLDVASAIEPTASREAGGAAAAVRLLLRESGFPDLEGLSTETIRGTPNLTRRRRRVAVQGIFALGDAAGYTEPFSGEGMSWAMQEALLLAPLLWEAIASPDRHHADLWQRRYERFARSRMRACRFAIWMRRHWTLATMAMAMLSRVPALAGPWVRAVNTPHPEIGRMTRHRTRSV